MENDHVEPKNDSGSVWGTLACTMACAVLLLLLAGVAVGFDPDSISTRTQALMFWLPQGAALAIMIVGLVRARSSFETIYRTETARERLMEPGV